MPEDPRRLAIEWLRDWSKWLITVDFAAVTGCTVVLQAGLKGPPRPFLLLAIAAFAISIAISVAVVRALSTAIETAAAAGEGSVLDLPLSKRLTIRTATRLQYGFLIAGVVFFLGWVALKPIPAG